MKIRLVSIEGKIADPIYNMQQMKKELERANKDKIDILVFPENSIIGVSIGETRYNTILREKIENAENTFNYLRHRYPNIEVYSNFDDEFIDSEVEDNSDDDRENMVVRNYPNIIETVEHLSSIEDEMKQISKEQDNLQILCLGNGTESVSQGVYSNVKIIAYKGQILASNLDNLGNVLDYDFDPDKTYSRMPYLDNIKSINNMFSNILNMQAQGLFGKMRSMKRFKICLGVSGGLDSTVSLLVCIEAFKKYHIPLKNIIGVTMPGLGTTERTYQNALNLMTNLGITIEDIDLRPLLKTHLKNISQPEGKFDVTYEQTQSRERTQVLLDIANRENAIMIGTGCMSEFALGWMTYGGDHLSMYAINIGLPKTVVKMYAQWFIDRYSQIPDFPKLDGLNNYQNNEIAMIVKDILDGPVSPELLPIDEKGEQHEKTESLIGDYLVQDFFIYHMTVEKCSITELFKRACNTFPEYSNKNILKWLEIFTLRYFTRAYKKNCYGDGLQIFEYSVSPWYYHIPSDIDNTVWQEEIEKLKNETGE